MACYGFLDARIHDRLRYSCQNQLFGSLNDLIVSCSLPQSDFLIFQKHLNYYFRHLLSNDYAVPRSLYFFATSSVRHAFISYQPTEKLINDKPCDILHIHNDQEFKKKRKKAKQKPINIMKEIQHHALLSLREIYQKYFFDENTSSWFNKSKILDTFAKNSTKYIFRYQDEHAETYITLRNAEHEEFLTKFAHKFLQISHQTSFNHDIYNFTSYDTRFHLQCSTDFVINQQNAYTVTTSADSPQTSYKNQQEIQSNRVTETPKEYLLTS
jgi:hypothetical protein